MSPAHREIAALTTRQGGLLSRLPATIPQARMISRHGVSEELQDLWKRDVLDMSAVAMRARKQVLSYTGIDWLRSLTFKLLKAHNHTLFGS